MAKVGERWPLDVEREFEKLNIRLRRMTRLLGFIARLEIKMAGELDALEVQVAKNTDIEQSAIVLLEGLKAALDAAGQDPVKLKALSDSLGVSADSLAAAIVANTPSA